MERCVKCGKELKSFVETAYGEKRCEICYDDYLMTDRGKVEYIIGLTTGELRMEEYDADFIGHAATFWTKYKEEFNLPLRFIKEIEAKAKQLGIL